MNISLLFALSLSITLSGHGNFVQISSVHNTFEIQRWVRSIWNMTLKIANQTPKSTSIKMKKNCFLIDVMKWAFWLNQINQLITGITTNDIMESHSGCSSGFNCLDRWNRNFDCYIERKWGVTVRLEAPVLLQMFFSLSFLICLRFAPLKTPSFHMQSIWY